VLRNAHTVLEVQRKSPMCAGQGVFISVSDCLPTRAAHSSDLQGRDDLAGRKSNHYKVVLVNMAINAMSCILCFLFHEYKLVDGISRLILPGANKL
jgi:hypothetical protein